MSSILFYRMRILSIFYSFPFILLSYCLNFYLFLSSPFFPFTYLTNSTLFNFTSPLSFLLLD